ncbi:hypothetical protein BHM03_00042488 [Ensete ventricosum]|nr:hypothetical protein BHM03_00042488 [Ensete ventricosum]
MKSYEDKYQRGKEAYLQVMRQEKREIDAMKLLEEEQLQKTAMELLQQYLQFKQALPHTGKSWKSTTSLSWSTKPVLSRTPRDLFNLAVLNTVNFLVAYAATHQIVLLRDPRD